LQRFLDLLDHALLDHALDRAHDHRVGWLPLEGLKAE
jgi:hypothetical protein